MFGRLFHLGGHRARQRAVELLEQFDLVDAADKGVKEYSGGMRRRLDLAASMILAPRVLFLDEPTTGLDPRGRNEVWDAVRDLVAERHHRAADHAVSGGGRPAGGPDHRHRPGPDHRRRHPGGLKSAVGGDRIEVVCHETGDVPSVVKVVARVCDGEPEIDDADRRVSRPGD